MKKKLIYLPIIILIVGNQLSCQEKVLFHKYYPTASSWKITDWNVSDRLSNKFIIKETVDTKGRVKELQFLKNGKLIPNMLCYVANRVTYEYKKNQIIERFFQNNDTPVSNECEMPYMKIYHLNKNYIKSIETFYKLDTISFSKNEIDYLKTIVPEKVTILCDSTSNSEIEYYYYSYAKNNYKYPTNKGYKFKYGHFYYDEEPVKSSIIRGLER